MEHLRFQQRETIVCISGNAGWIYQTDSASRFQTSLPVWRVKRLHRPAFYGGVATMVLSLHISSSRV